MFRLFRSQPEDGFMRKAEICRCYDYLIFFYLFNKGYVILRNFIYSIEDEAIVGFLTAVGLNFIYSIEDEVIVGFLTAVGRNFI
jgi:hypothetical protein